MHPSHRPPHPLTVGGRCPRRVGFSFARARARGVAVLVLALAGAALLVASPARAEDKRAEAAAKDALKKIAADYKAESYDAAIARLQKALQTCGPSKCTAGTKAMLMRDLGVMQLRKGEVDAAEALFAEALKLEPDLELNPNYEAPELQAEWQGAKDEAAAAKGSQPSGDFTHTPAAAQTTRTPLPVFAEYSGSTPITSVVIRYKGTGMREYKRVSLSKTGTGWGGLIPCADVARGVVRYYIQGFGSDGSPVAGSGSAREPYYVPIRSKIAGSAPSLPGASPPKKCTGESGGGGGGASSGGGGGTSGGEPAARKLEDGEACDEAAQCVGGACQNGECTTAHSRPKEEGGYARIWFGVSGSVDFVSLPAATDVCKLSTKTPLPFNTAGYYCTNPDGTDFPTRANPAENATLTQGNSGNAPGGLTGRDLRIMITFDYALSPSLLVGARLGYVFNAYPGDAASKDGHAFAPIHLELRATYLFGDAPLAHSGLAPFVFAGGGAAEFDGVTTVQVTQTGIAGERAKLAWITSGPLFVAAGAGVRYAFSPRVAFLASARFAGAFGGAGGFFPAVAPEIALHYGF